MSQLVQLGGGGPKSTSMPHLKGKESMVLKLRFTGWMAPSSGRPRQHLCARFDAVLPQTKLIEAGSSVECAAKSQLSSFEPLAAVCLGVKEQAWIRE